MPNPEHKGRDEISLLAQPGRLESGMCMQHSLSLKVKAFSSMQIQITIRYWVNDMLLKTFLKFLILTVTVRCNPLLCNFNLKILIAKRVDKEVIHLPGK